MGATETPFTDLSVEDIWLAKAPVLFFHISKPHCLWGTSELRIDNQRVHPRESNFQKICSNLFIWYGTRIAAPAITRRHCNDVIMDSMASQITNLTIVNSAVYSGADLRKHQRSASLAFVRGIHRGPHKWPVSQKTFPFDDVIMCTSIANSWTSNYTHIKEWDVIIYPCPTFKA